MLLQQMMTKRKQHRMLKSLSLVAIDSLGDQWGRWPRDLSSSSQLDGRCASRGGCPRANCFGEFLCSQGRRERCTMIAPQRFCFEAACCLLEVNEKLGKSQFEPPAGSTVDKQVGGSQRRCSLVQVDRKKKKVQRATTAGKNPHASGLRVVRTCKVQSS